MFGQKIIDKIIKEGLVSAESECVSVWEKDSAEVLSEFVEKEYSELLNKALRAICLTRDYVGEEVLPPIIGWEWFDAGTLISESIPSYEWSHEFRLRVGNEENDYYKARLTEEKSQLDERIEKLSYFIAETKQFNDLPERDQSLLERQCDVMEDYALILDERIALFD